MIDLYYWPTQQGGSVQSRIPGAESWQVAGLGPMAGQAHHFLRYAPQKIEYAMHRYRTEVSRLYRVLDTQLAKSGYIAGDYSIADIAAWPWVVRS